MSAVQFHDSAVLFGDADLNDTDKVAMHEDCCCEPEFEECNGCSGTVPSQLSVTLANIAEDGCGNCIAGLNDTFVLDRYAGCEDDNDNCMWLIEFSPAICEVGGIFVTAALGGITVVLWLDGSGPLDPGPCSGSAVRLKFNEVGDLPDCDAWSSEDIDYDDQSVAWNCDGISATCELTAL